MFPIITFYFSFQNKWKMERKRGGVYARVDAERLIKKKKVCNVSQNVNVQWALALKK